VARILIVDADRESGRQMRDLLGGRGHEVVEVARPEELRAIDRDPFDVAVVGDRHRDGGAALAGVLERLRERFPDASLVLAGGDPAGARAGIDAERLLDALDEVVGAEPKPSGEEAGRAPLGGIVGRSPAIRELLLLIEKIATTDSTVLVTGETGTGKELVGRAIHEASRRAGRVFCAVNSAAVPESLLESELFGHRRGSFTGANANKRGLFEHADHGTMFLDEVAEMPLPMQAKLLRFLQTGELRAVGSETSRYVDVRLVTATNKDLEREVAEGRFREDLYYRLAVIPIHVPPLRERREDIPLLAEHFLRRFARKAAKPVERIGDDALELLLACPWPGNVRQLENTIESGVALCRGRVLTAGDLPARLRERRAPEPPARGLQSLANLERAHILHTLEIVGWNRKRAAEILEISTTTLWRRLKEFGIESQGPPTGRI
jgi:DNA-binding NtrC family response regulator